ncbi:hypothetical protein [Polynucleobacter sp. CS-Odin-A6]|uniref:hypothetical protein n=1 Tax=Polynucleobacter sp. CS-Odin-A6 TaxID=2689106 RepID=UPI001C0CC1D7|nr:hypothetical protein [Polynucleobacter sp. CS-Odin-A6]MBU3620344.1 hypothetical protein [Polynucleobacter sp. CS-Odin-A6]
MKYKITITGSGGDFGCGSISEEQYDFWSDESNQQYLADALQESLDEDLLEVPAEAQFSEHYSQYGDVGSVTGIYEDDFHILVTDPKGTTIFSGTFSDLYALHEDSEDINTDDSGELYVPFTAAEEGFYIYWEDFRSGTYIETEIETAHFDPLKLKFEFWDLNGGTPLYSKVFYEDLELDTDGGSMDQTYLQCSVHHNG